MPFPSDPDSEHYQSKPEHVVTKMSPSVLLSVLLLDRFALT